MARALVAAVRNWTIYPPEHPRPRLDRSPGRRDPRLDAGRGVGDRRHPETLMIEGAAADHSQPGIAEAAAMLHDRDIITISFSGHVPSDTIQAFLRVLALDPAERRDAADPADLGG